jgi:hypothetical protein
MRLNALLRLYPGAWRDRYGEEMSALLEQRQVDRHDRFDLVRGALDAWLHPPVPSRIPIVAALAGGGLWTVTATAVLAQPVPPDWPGYLLEIVPLAFVGAICLFVAVAACLLRIGELGRRRFVLVTALVAVGYLAWISALGATMLGAIGGPVLAAGQAVAMIATVVVGLGLVRGRDEPTGFLLIAAPVAMLVPWTGTWLAFGLAWTAIGIVLFIDRAGRLAGPGRSAGETA